MVLNDGSDQSESGRHSQKGKEAIKHDKVFRWRRRRRYGEEEKKDKAG